MKMKAFVENIDTIRERRGFLPECMQCPLQLVCAGGQTPNLVWCPTCKMYYSVTLGKRVDCDALEPRVTLDMGICPCTFGATTFEDVIYGVQIFTRTERT